MKRRDYKGKVEEGGFPENLYRKARSMNRESLRSESGPAQIDVIKTYSAAARGFERRRDFYKAKEVLEEAEKYLGPKKFAATDPELVKKISSKLEQIKAKLPIKQRGKLERNFVFAILAMGSLVTALFFSIFSLTGYVTDSLTQESSRLTGTILFVLGLVCAFFYFRKNK